MKDKGFTPIELMIVIAIIMILAAIALPEFIAFRNKASNITSVISDIHLTEKINNHNRINNSEVVTKCINGSLYIIKDGKESKMVKKDSSVIGGLSDVYCYD